MFQGVQLFTSRGPNRGPLLFKPRSPLASQWPHHERSRVGVVTGIRVSEGTSGMCNSSPNGGPKAMSRSMGSLAVKAPFRWADLEGSHHIRLAPADEAAELGWTRSLPACGKSSRGARRSLQRAGLSRSYTSAHLVRTRRGPQAASTKISVETVGANSPGASTDASAVVYSY